MELQTGRIFEPQVTGIEGYWVHVAVSQDARFSEQFICTVSLYLREADSQWGGAALGGPVGQPQVLREFRTPLAAYEHGLAFGHLLTTIY